MTLAVAARNGVGAALIDTNGDEADVDLDVYERDADGVWIEAGSLGAGRIHRRARLVDRNREPRCPDPEQ